MKFISTILLSIMLLMFSLTSSAAITCATNYCSGPASELIEGLFAAQSGGDAFILIETPQQLMNDLNCAGASGGNNVKLSSAGDGRVAYEETFAILMSAVMSNKDVLLRIFTSSPTCELYYARILN